GGRASRHLAHRHRHLRAPSERGEALHGLHLQPRGPASPRGYRRPLHGAPRGQVSRRPAEAQRAQAPPRRSRGAGETQRGDQDALRGVLRGLRPLAMARELTVTARPLPSRLAGLDRSAPVWIVAAAHLLLLMLLPLAWLGYLSVSGEGGLTLAHYARVFTDARLQKALWNTVVLAFWSALLSLAIGAPMAWLTARTDLPGKRVIRGLVMASFVTPPFLGAFAWVMLAGPNAGYLNKLYRELTGAETPLLNIFTMPGLIFVVALYTFPYAYIMIVNTLELIASDLEEAASILGASRLWVALTVTLPMVAPAILSGFILSVLQALALFGSPAILALPAGFHTITTQIWALFQYPPKVEMAAAFSGPLFLATALLLFIQKQLLGRRGYATIGGKGGARRRIPLGPERAPPLASRDVREPLAPVRCLPAEGDARGLLAVRRDLAGSPPRARGGGTHPRCGAPARARRDHGAARPERHHRHLVLRLNRGHPRAVGVDHPLHAQHQGDLGRDLRPEGGGPVRRHRGPRPL